jgi:hypothetical protein
VPRNDDGTQNCMTPARQLFQIRLFLMRLRFPPAIRRPVPTGALKAGQTTLGSRSAMGRFFTKQYASRSSVYGFMLFE